LGTEIAKGDGCRTNQPHKAGHAGLAEHSQTLRQTNTTTETSSIDVRKTNLLEVPNKKRQRIIYHTRCWACVHSFSTGGEALGTMAHSFSRQKVAVVKPSKLCRCEPRHVASQHGRPVYWAELVFSGVMCTLPRKKIGLHCCYLSTGLSTMPLANISGSTHMRRRQTQKDLPQGGFCLSLRLWWLAQRLRCSHKRLQLCLCRGIQAPFVAPEQCGPHLLASSPEPGRCVARSQQRVCTLRQLKTVRGKESRYH